MLRNECSKNVFVWIRRPLLCLHTIDIDNYRLPIKSAMCHVHFEGIRKVMETATFQKLPADSYINRE